MVPSAWNFHRHGATSTREVGRTTTSKVDTHNGSIDIKLKLTIWVEDMDQAILDHMYDAKIACLEGWTVAS